MLTLISPAKTLDWSDPSIDFHSLPDFQKETFELVSVMKKKSVEDIKELMDISDNLAVLNKKRYLDFQKRFDFSTSKQALLAFHGDVYTQIEVQSYSKDDFEFAQAPPEDTVRTVWPASSDGPDPTLSIGNGGAARKQKGEKSI
jgi:uncharacterized protein